MTKPFVFVKKYRALSVIVFAILGQISCDESVCTKKEDVQVLENIAWPSDKGNGRDHKQTIEVTRETVEKFRRGLEERVISEMNKKRKLVHEWRFFLCEEISGIKIKAPAVEPLDEFKGRSIAEPELVEAFVEGMKQAQFYSLCYEEYPVFASPLLQIVFETQDEERTVTVYGFAYSLTDIADEAFFFSSHGLTSALRKGLGKEGELFGLNWRALAYGNKHIVK
jgi:hypothetical protein